MAHVPLGAPYSRMSGQLMLAMPLILTVNTTTTTNRSTMKTSIISFFDSENESVEAAYYVMEDEWVTFKSDDHKAAAAYPLHRVMAINSRTGAT